MIVFPDSLVFIHAHGFVQLISNKQGERRQRSCWPC
jgi:hypothetical protein